MMSGLPDQTPSLKGFLKAQVLPQGRNQGVLLKVPHPSIALPAQQAPDSSGYMIMIDGQTTDFSGDSNANFWLTTDSADSLLFINKGSVLFGCNPI
jgi:hypothetical protein